MAIGINDPLDAFIVAATKRGACEPALVWLADRRREGKTVRQMAAMLVDENQPWANWARTEMADDLTPAVLYAMSDMATRDQPRVAAHFDIFIATSRTEGAMLAARWKPDEFPNLARQLDDGVVKRRRG